MLNSSVHIQINPRFMWIGFCTGRYRKMWVARSGRFRGCSIVGGLCHTHTHQRVTHSYTLTHERIYVLISRTYRHIERVRPHVTHSNTHMHKRVYVSQSYMTEWLIPTSQSCWCECGKWINASTCWCVWYDSIVCLTWYVTHVMMSRVSSVSPCMYIHTTHIWMCHGVYTYIHLKLTWYVTRIISLSLFLHVYPTNMNETWRIHLHAYPRHSRNMSRVFTVVFCMYVRAPHIRMSHSIYK